MDFIFKRRAEGSPRGLALCVFGAALALGGCARSGRPAPPDALADGGDAQRLVTLVDYIGGDYAGAVKDGRVLDEGEYAEQLKFVTDARALAKGLGGDPALLAAVGEIERLVQAKADPDVVQKACRAGRESAVTLFGLDTTPLQRPNLARAQALYAGPRSAGPVARGVACRGPARPRLGAPRGRIHGTSGGRRARPRAWSGAPRRRRLRRRPARRGRPPGHRRLPAGLRATGAAAARPRRRGDERDRVRVPRVARVDGPRRDRRSRAGPGPVPRPEAGHHPRPSRGALCRRLPHLPPRRDRSGPPGRRVAGGPAPAGAPRGGPVRPRPLAPPPPPRGGPPLA